MQTTPRGQHVVRFYERHADLYEMVSAFVVEGLASAQRVVLLITESNWAAVRERVARRVQIDAAIAEGMLVVKDADRVVEEISAGGAPDRHRFIEIVTPLVTSTAGGVRVFGEVVSVLAARHAMDAALELETCGHALTEQLGASVLCAYNLADLDREPGCTSRVAACHDHAALAPIAASRAGILLAEDFEDCRELYRDYLEFTGYNVITAADGIEAVERARSERPALILMDIQMPRMNGIEAMQILRREPLTANVPILALTAHALDSDRAAFVAMGFDAVVSKPCLPDDLVRIIEGALPVTEA